MTAREGGQCPHHEDLKEKLNDLDERQREKQSRLTVLELEGRHMKESIDRLTLAIEKMQTSLDELRVWNVKFMAIFVTLTTLAGLVASHWPTIARLLGGGA